MILKNSIVNNVCQKLTGANVFIGSFLRRRIKTVVSDYPKGSIRKRPFRVPLIICHTGTIVPLPGSSTCFTLRFCSFFALAFHVSTFQPDKINPTKDENTFML